ncbi:MAG: hypothetical protein H7061_11290 [Bdellovibrionaceae bacterium]|nr:hypothetical protein [Bdellovibrio sp.]
MMKLFALLIFMASFAHAEAPRQQQLNEIFQQFSRRFASGHYVNDVVLMKDFIAKQDAMASALKKNGALKKVLFIENDYTVKLNVTVYAFTDEQNNLLGVYWDKSVYDCEEEYSLLRFASLDMVATGLKFMPISGTSAIVVVGARFVPATGGTLQFNYLKDFGRKEWGSMNLFLQKKAATWAIYNEQSQVVTQGFVKTWTGFLNGGVKEILLK